MSDGSNWPWATTVLATASVAMYVVTGVAAEYSVDAATDRGQRPTIEDLTLDVFRHPSNPAMVASLAFFVPVAWTTERILGGLGTAAVAATYIVSGFAAGFVEVLLVQDTVMVVGGYGATTGVIATWCITRWRHQHDALLPAAVALAWMLVGGHLYAGVPWLGTCAAALVGLYAIDGLPQRGSALHPSSQADRP